MDRDLPTNIARSAKSGLQIDRISQIITERWPEIWQASIDRQDRLLKQRHNLLLVARQQLQKKAS
jgi:hypothetical protein